MRDTMKKTTRFKQMLQSQQLEFLMEAHSGLSARIAEEAGFQGLWGSGLSLSAAMGVRDNNEASWTQVLEAVEYMADRITSYNVCYTKLLRLRIVGDAPRA